MAELDVEALRQRPLTCRQGEPDCEFWAGQQVAIIAALEDRDRLRAVVGEMLWSEVRIGPQLHGFLLSQADHDRLRAALEGRDD